MLTPPLDSWLRLPRGPIALAVLVAGTLLFGSLQRQPCIPDREIVELEVAGTTAKANTILSDWTAQCAARPGSTVGRQEVEAQVRASLRWDFAFIAFYATLLAFGCTLAARTLPRDPTGRFASALAALAWLQWPAGAFDAVENVALLKFLEGPTGVPWLRIAQGAALAKFALVIPGAAAAIVGLLVWLRRRARQSAQPELSVRSFKDVLAAERAQIE